MVSHLTQLDTTVKVSELVKDIIEDTDHQADHGLDNTELGITATQHSRYRC